MDLLDRVDCRDSNKKFVAYKYRTMFGADIDGPSARHLRWYRRMAPVFSLPRGASILDFGGGYGIDTIFFAALGYETFLYEITPHQLAIARAFAGRFEERFGKLPIFYIHAGHDEAPQGLDAVMIKEVAHHIEPVRSAFDASAAMLRSGGHLFLLEPNFWNPAIQANFFRIRGYRTVERRVDEETGAEYLVGNENIRAISAWNRHARNAGFTLRNADYFIPWPRKSAEPLSWQRSIEQIPIARDLLASHVTLHYVKA
jgi:SAM-dependent methyltransferase